MEYLSVLLKRDGFNCMYCKQPLDYDSMIYEHLNDNRNDNRIENLTLSHQSCNIKKTSYYDYQLIAVEKLKENESKLYVGEKNYLEAKEPAEVSTEININITNFEICEQFLAETINTDGAIEYSDALDSIVYLCKKKTGHGSQQSVRNYISTLTSLVAPFMIARNEKGKKIIIKRGGN